MASGTSPNSTNIALVGAGASQATPVTVSPEYRYFRPDWLRVRDVLAGQREIKRAGVFYLPKLRGMDAEDYDAYLQRATFYNMTAQTQNGMLGQVFRKDPIIRKLPAKFKNEIPIRFAKDGTGHVGFCKTVMSEQIAMGRFGVLVDSPPGNATIPTSFAVGYTTENILDWRVESIDGFFQLTRVLIREFERKSASAPDQNNPWLRAASVDVLPGTRKVVPAKAPQRLQVNRKVKGSPQLVESFERFDDAYTYDTIYRELLLLKNPQGEWQYIQNVYYSSPSGLPDETFYPNVRGKPLNFIPFCFFGSVSNSADVERSPLIDIADLNLSHYRTYAELEYGRLFTALPVYYAPGQDGEGVSNYHIGPNVVWEVPEGSTPGILEYKGQGLGALERALSTKEQQIAAIGGRLMAGSKSAGSESTDQTSLRESNEQAVLLNVITACETGMSLVIRWWLMFRDIPLLSTMDLDYQINQDFLNGTIGAREMRAIQLMYDGGIIPLETLFDYLRSAEVVDPEMEFDEFRTLLNDPTSFVNSPDALSRQRGYSDRAQELNQAQIAREADFQQQELDLQEREVVLQENAPPAPVKVPPAAGPLPAKANPSIKNTPGATKIKIATTPKGNAGTGGSSGGK